MKPIVPLLLFFFLLQPFIPYAQSSTSPDNLKIILIRHGEKPEKGSNLTCKGLNRSLQLPLVIKAKFGVPDYTYVPSLKMGDKTSHARMFETVIPLSARYNLAINSKYDEKDINGLVAEIKNQKGTTLIVWEHSVIAGIAHALGISDELTWPSEDYDSIWIVSYVNGKAVLSKDKEGLNPSDDCP
jgi:hypothetical protein